MYSLYKKIRPFLLILCAAYFTGASYLLGLWAPIGFEGSVATIFVVSLLGSTLGMWAFTVYQLWKWKTGSALSFAEVLAEKIDAAMSWEIKRFLNALPAQMLAKWKIMLERIVDHGDRQNLLIDTFSLWLVSTIAIYTGMYAAYKYASPLMGALLVLLLVVAQALNAILLCDAGRYFWRNGKRGYKHNRPTVAY